MFKKYSTMRNSLNLSRLPNGLVVFQSSLRVHKVRRKNCVDHGTLPESSLAYTPNNVNPPVIR